METVTALSRGPDQDGGQDVTQLGYFVMVYKKKLCQSGHFYRVVIKLKVEGPLCNIFNYTVVNNKNATNNQFD